MRTRLLLALSLALFSACGDDGGSADAGPDARITGTFNIAWTVNGASGAAGCDAVGAQLVRIEVIEVDAANGTVESFPCADGSDTSRELVPGTYRLTIDLRTADNSTLLASPIVEMVDVPEGGNGSADAVDFTVSSMGSLRFSATAQGAASNCGALADGGAGITAFRFNLKDDAGDCVPSDFVAGGATYSSDCTDTPTPVACFEPTQEITVDPTSSGPRTLEIIGIVGGNPCRKHSGDLVIPGAGLEEDAGARSLAVDTAEPGCENL